MAARTIRWTKLATAQFRAAINYIKQDSDQNGEKVREKIISKIDQLAEGILVHRKDPYKKDNDGSFLYFEIEKYRIVYQAKQNEIIIIRVRHTSMEPKMY